MIELDLMIIVIFAIFAATLIKAISGFGNALIFYAILANFIDIKSAIGIFSIWGALSDFLNLYHYRNHIDKQFTLRSWYAIIPGTVLGAFMIINTQQTIIRLLLGIFIIIYSTNKLRKDFGVMQNKKGNKLLKKTIQSDTNGDKNENTRSIRDKKNNIERIAADGDLVENRMSPVFFHTSYFFYGFLASFIGAAGPINVAILERNEFNKERFVANFSSTSFPALLIILTLYSIGGIYSVEFIPIWIIGLPFVFLASKIGYRIIPRISAEKFGLIVLILLISTGINLIIRYFTS